MVARARQPWPGRARSLAPRRGRPGQERFDGLAHEIHARGDASETANEQDAYDAWLKAADEGYSPTWAQLFHVWAAEIMLAHLSEHGHVDEGGLKAAEAVASEGLLWEVGRDLRARIKSARAGDTRTIAGASTAEFQDRFRRALRWRA